MQTVPATQWVEIFTDPQVAGIFQHKSASGVFIKSQGRSVLPHWRLSVPLDRRGIDWQMAGRMHNMQLIKEPMRWNPSNCRRAL